MQVKVQLLLWETRMFVGLYTPFSSDYEAPRKSRDLDRVCLLGFTESPHKHCCKRVCKNAGESAAFTMGDQNVCGGTR
jgi:hypothetical protein